VTGIPRREEILLRNITAMLWEAIFSPLGKHAIIRKKYKAYNFTCKYLSGAKYHTFGGRIFKYLVSGKAKS
jgi:hypothetical protein